MSLILTMSLTQSWREAAGFPNSLPGQGSEKDCIRPPGAPGLLSFPPNTHSPERGLESHSLATWVGQAPLSSFKNGHNQSAWTHQTQVTYGNSVCRAGAHTLGTEAGGTRPPMYTGQSPLSNRLSHLGTSPVIWVVPNKEDLRTLIQALPGVNRRVASTMVSTWLPQGPQRAGAQRSHQRTTHTLTESHPLHVSSRSAGRHALSFQASVAVSQLPAPDMTQGWLPTQRHQRSAPVLYLLSDAGQLSHDALAGLSREYHFVP